MQENRNSKSLDILLNTIENSNGIKVIEVNQNQIQYLESELLVKQYGEKYFTTVKGKVFIENGGFIGIIKKQKLSDRFQIAFWSSAIINLIFTIYLFYNSTEQTQLIENSRTIKCSKESLINIDTTSNLKKFHPIEKN